MIIVQKTNVLNVIFWTDNCYLCHIMIAPWRIIKDFDQLQNYDKNGWPVKLKRIIFSVLHSNPQPLLINMDFEYVSLYQRDMHNKCCNGKAWCVKVRLIYFHSLLVNVIHVLSLIKLRIFVELSVRLWHGFWFSLLVFKDKCKRNVLLRLMKKILFYRIRCNGGNITSESVSSIQIHQHCCFQYTVIFGYFLPFKDYVFGSCKFDRETRCFIMILLLIFRELYQREMLQKKWYNN